ncbi:hypothetical protein [Streptomyces qinzhouensis]|uniref:Repetin n=1 Tax=Streptomyces qinzhouensis TaxID=2599401 RepID=A0A5B8JJL5_9ACTN|nr:hypothetical protein [Streptomyces qinzhouensis]QDY78040.1 hypothetical protein FQU76_17740 [Streptomyces qinzhouensis]
MRRRLTAPRTVALAGATAALLAGTVSASTAANESRPGERDGHRPAAAAPAGEDRGAATARVKGSARIHFTLRPQDTIRFTIDATAVPYSKPLPGVPTGLPTDARGTLRFSHYIPETGRTGWAVADVDCLSTGGKTATVTAIVRKTNVERVGKRVGISFQQGENGAPSRAGFSWGIVNADGGTDGAGAAGGTGTCQAPAPFAPAIDGGYRVTHTEVPPIPTNPR